MVTVCFHSPFLEIVTDKLAKPSQFYDAIWKICSFL